MRSVTGGVPRFTVRMVSNSGAYAVPGWWWYYGQTFANVVSLLNTNNGRLIEIEPYDAGGGVIRFAIVMVSNTGAAARAWSWLAGVSSAQITTHLNRSGHRLIDLDTYTEGGVKKYAVVLVRNTGAALSQDHRRGGDHVGLENVARRLAGHYGSAATLTLGVDPTGATVAELQLPITDLAAAPEDAHAETAASRTGR